jgi:hypothetical protein
MRQILPVTIDETLWMLMDVRAWHGLDTDELIKERLSPVLSEVLGDRRGEITSPSRTFFVFEDNDKYGEEDGLWGLLTHP